MNEQEVEKREEIEEVEVTQVTPEEGSVVPEKQFPGWFDLLATVGVFALSIVVGTFIIASMMKSRGVEAPTPDMTFIYYLIQMLPTVAFVIWLRRRAGRDNGIHFGANEINIPIVLWGVVVLIASGVVLEPLLNLFPSDGYESVTNSIGLGGWAVLSTVLAAPVLEEVLFRGLIFESCKERFGDGVAILTSSLLFAIVHVVPIQMVNAFVVGLILGYIYLKTGSLLSVIILHAINNAIAYITLAYFGASASSITTESLFGSSIAYWVVYALSVVLLMFALMRLWNSLHSVGKTNLTKL